MGLLKIAFISTFPPQICGIGTYTSDLIKSLYGKIEYKVFSEGLYWKRGTPMAKLAHEILSFKPDIIHIQHAYGFFYNISEFVAFLKLLKNENIVITFH